MPRSCIKISDVVVFGIPSSASSSHTLSHWSLLIAAQTHSPFSGVLLVASLPECGSLLRYLPIIEAFMPQFYLLCSHCIFPESLLNHPNSFHGGMFKLCHFEWGSHTVHRLTQWHLPPPLTSTVKLSCSHIHIPVHSPWLPGYISVVQTILATLTMARLFLDRPHMCSFVC